jgi:hypothetical protein
MQRCAFRRLLLDPAIRAPGAPERAAKEAADRRGWDRRGGNIQFFGNTGLRYI